MIVIVKRVIEILMCACQLLRFVVSVVRLLIHEIPDTSLCEELLALFSSGVVESGGQEGGSA